MLNDTIDENNNQPLISVIIPNYNSFATVASTLKGLLEMEGDYVKEIIVVDSSDDLRTRSILENFNDCIKMVYLDEKTIPAIGRNIGAQMSTGDVVAFIDSDAYPEPNWAQKICEVYRQGYMVGGGSYLIPEFQRNCNVALAQYFLQFSEFIGGEKRKCEFVPSCNIFCQKKLFEKAGGFPEVRAMEDVEFGKTVSKLSELYYFPDMRVFHIFREDRSSFFNNQKMLGYCNALIRKGKGSLLLHKNLSIILFGMFFIRKLMLVTKRSLTSNMLYNRYFIRSFVELNLGVFYWTMGFAKGCRIGNPPVSKNSNVL